MGKKTQKFGALSDQEILKIVDADYKREKQRLFEQHKGRQKSEYLFHRADGCRLLIDKWHYPILLCYFAAFPVEGALSHLICLVHFGNSSNK